MLEVASQFLGRAPVLHDIKLTVPEGDGGDLWNTATIPTASWPCWEESCQNPCYLIWKKGWNYPLSTCQATLIKHTVLYFMHVYRLLFRTSQPTGGRKLKGEYLALLGLCSKNIRKNFQHAWSWLCDRESSSRLWFMEAHPSFVHSVVMGLRSHMGLVNDFVLRTKCISICKKQYCQNDDCHIFICKVLSDWSA